MHTVVIYMRTCHQALVMNSALCTLGSINRVFTFPDMEEDKQSLAC